MKYLLARVHAWQPNNSHIISTKKELYNLGIQENLNDQITLVELPKIIKKIKVKNSINLTFEYKKNYTERYLSIISKNKKILNEFK